MPDFLHELASGFAVKPIQKAKRNLNIAESSGVDPAAHGRLLDAGANIGLTPQGVEQLPKLKVEMLDRQKQRIQALQQSVATQEYFAAQPNNAIVSYRDVERLGNIENFADTVSKYAKAPPTLTARVSATAASLISGPVAAVGGLGRSIYGLFQWTNEFDRNLSEMTGIQFGTIRDAVGDEDYAKFLQDNLDVARDLPQALHVALTGDDFELADEILRQVNRNQFTDPIFGIGLGDVAGGAVSLAPTVLTGGAGLGINAMAAVAGMQSFGSTFANQQDKGNDFAESSGMAILSGTITAALTRFIPGGAEKGAQFLARHPNAKDYIARSLSGTILKEAGLEFVEEYADEFLQGLLVEGKDWDSAMSDAWKAGGIGALLGGGLNVAPAIYSVKEAQAKEAQTFGDAIDELRTAVQETDTNTNSPESMKSFLHDFSNLPEEVHADGVELLEAMQDPAAREQIESAGADFEQVKAAAETGGSVPLKLAGLMAGMDDATYKAIHPLIRKHTSSLSVKEGVEFGESSDIEQAVQEADALSKDQQAFEGEARRLKKEAAVAHVGVDNKHLADTALPIIQGAWSMYSRNRDYYQSKGQTASDFLRRVSIKFKEDGSAVVDQNQTYNQDPKAYIAAQPKGMQSELTRAHKEMRKAQIRLGKKLTTEQEVSALNRMAYMEWGRSHSTIGIDQRTDSNELIEKDDPSTRDIFKKAPKGWKDSAVDIDVEGLNKAGDAVKYLSKREKIAEGLIKCLSK